MATYVIGDVHGCLKTLKQLLNTLACSEKDTLYFTGDLVNRGPQSLQVLQFIKQCPYAHIVLGNHDLHALALYSQKIPWHKPHTLQALLASEQAPSLFHWLRQQPLLRIDKQHQLIISHAGLHPHWQPHTAQQYANEVSAFLQQDDWASQIKHLYGNLPNQWQPNLQGFDRLRMITNILTRMRFCDQTLALDFDHTGPPGSQPKHLAPWYTFTHQHQDYTAVFGHWAALKGNIQHNQCISLDGGCVYGGTLLAYDVIGKTIIQQPFCP
jgi:bis(5'-nucleosyl)-tetraphosphatase (symmetrical)